MSNIEYMRKVESLKLALEKGEICHKWYQAQWNAYHKLFYRAW